MARPTPRALSITKLLAVAGGRDMPAQAIIVGKMSQVAA
jgi:hypothetical protein